MKNFIEWHKNKSKEIMTFAEYTAKPVTSPAQQQQANYPQDPRLQQVQPQDQGEEQENMENDEPTEKDKLIYQGEMKGQLGTFLNLMQRAMYQRQQIFKRPAMVGLFLQDMIKLAVQLSTNPTLVNRILLKLRADVSGTDVTNMALTPDIQRGMDRLGKAVDPNTGRVVAANSVQSQDVQ